MKSVMVESTSLDVELANLYRRRQALDQLIRALEVYSDLEERPAPVVAGAFASSALAV